MLSDINDQQTEYWNRTGNQKCVTVQCQDHVDVYLFSTHGFVYIKVALGDPYNMQMSVPSCNALKSQTFAEITKIIGQKQDIAGYISFGKLWINKWGYCILYCT